MRWMILIGAVTLCGVGLFMIRNGLLNRPSGTPNLAASNSADGRQKLRIFAAGVVEGMEAPVQLRFETAGRIKSVRVREGESVRMDRVLAELEREPYELRMIQAEAQLQIAVAEREKLNRERRTSGPPAATGRDAPLEQEGANRLVSATSLVSKEDWIIANARVAVADAAVKQEQLLIDKTRLIAPMNGTVLAVALKEREMAGPTESDSITIVNRERTRVRAFVEELDAMEVAVGQSATVTASGRMEWKYAGRIVSCAPYVQPKSHRHLNPGERLDVRVREIVVELDDGADLLIGLPVEVFINVEAPEDRSDPPRNVPRAKKTGGLPDRD